MQYSSVIVILLILLYYSAHQSDFWQLKPQVSSIDAKTYFVSKDLENKQAAADTLARVRLSVDKIVEHLQKELKEGRIQPEFRANVLLLLRRYPYNKGIYELVAQTNTRTIAYNQNKAESIFVCLREDKNNSKMGDINAVMYVVLHEIAHTMVAHYDPEQRGETQHSAEFRRCEAFVYEHASKLGLVDPGRARGSTHCGMILP